MVEGVNDANFNCLIIMLHICTLNYSYLVQILVLIGNLEYNH